MYSNYQQPTSGPIQSSQNPPLLEVFNDLENFQNVQVKKLVPKDEQIFYSGVVEKINKNSVTQRRILVITNKSLYNIQPDDEGLIPSLIFSISPSSAMKRKIDIKKIFGITLSVSPQSDKEQFIIHVTGEYDYRYNGGKKREAIVKTIMNVYWCLFKTPFVLYMKEESDLVKYHVTEEDHKNHINKRPKDGQILATKEMMANGLLWIITNRAQFMQISQPKPQPQFIQSRPVIQNVVANPVPLYTNQPLTTTKIMTIQPTVQVQPITVVQRVPVTNVIAINTIPTAQIVTNRVVTTTQPQYMAAAPNVNYPINTQVRQNIPTQPQNYAPQNFGPQAYAPQPVQEKPTQPSSNNYQPGFVPNDLISSTYQNVQVTTNFESTLEKGNGKK